MTFRPLPPGRRGRGTRGTSVPHLTTLSEPGLRDNIITHEPQGINKENDIYTGQNGTTSVASTIPQPHRRHTSPTVSTSPNAPETTIAAPTLALDKKHPGSLSKLQRSPPSSESNPVCQVIPPTISPSLNDGLGAFHPFKMLLPIYTVPFIPESIDCVMDEAAVEMQKNILKAVKKLLNQDRSKIEEFKINARLYGNNFMDPAEYFQSLVDLLGGLRVLLLVPCLGSIQSDYVKRKSLLVAAQNYRIKQYNKLEADCDSWSDKSEVTTSNVPVILPPVTSGNEVVQASKLEKVISTKEFGVEAENASVVQVIKEGTESTSLSCLDCESKPPRASELFLQMGKSCAVAEAANTTSHNPTDEVFPSSCTSSTGDHNVEDNKKSVHFDEKSVKIPTDPIPKSTLNEALSLFGKSNTTECSRMETTVVNPKQESRHSVLLFGLATAGAGTSSESDSDFDD